MEKRRLSKGIEPLSVKLARFEDFFLCKNIKKLHTKIFSACKSNRNPYLKVVATIREFYSFGV